MRKRHHAVLIACLALAAIISGCRQESDAHRGDLSMAALRDIAAYTIDEFENGTPIAELVDLYPVNSDSVLILDSVDPFIRVYGRGGRVRSEFAKAGQGPGELVRPTPVVLLGDTLFTHDMGQNRIVTLLLNPYREISRQPLPHGTAHLFKGCGGIGAVVQLVPSMKLPEQLAGDVQNYTMAMYDGTGWQLRTGEWPGLVFVQAPGNWVSAARGDSILLVHDWFHNRLQVLDCETGLIRQQVDIPYPEHWGIPPRPRGAAWVGNEALVFFTGATRVRADTTHIVQWNPATNRFRVDVLVGRLSLHAVSGDDIWFTDSDVVPTPMRLSTAEFLRFLNDR